MINSEAGYHRHTHIHVYAQVHAHQKHRTKTQHQVLIDCKEMGLTVRWRKQFFVVDLFLHPRHETGDILQTIEEEEQ